MHRFIKNKDLTPDELSRVEQINNEICHLMQYLGSKLHRWACSLIDGLASEKYKIMGVDKWLRVDLKF